jgi:hypothetical protein
MASSICHIYLFLITFKERKKEKERESTIVATKQQADGTTNTTNSTIELLVVLIVQYKYHQ